MSIKNSFSSTSTSTSNSTSLSTQIKEITQPGLSIYDIAEYFHDSPYFVFLDSHLHENNLGKYSFLAFDPFLIFKSKGNTIWIREGNTTEEEEKTVDNIFDTLSEILTRFRIPGNTGEGISPFTAGGIGYLGYELGRQIEVLPATTRDIMNIPGCYFCFYNTAIIYDWEKNKLFASYFDPGCSENENIKSIDHLLDLITCVPPGLYCSKPISPGWKTIDGQFEISPFKPDFTREEYIKAVSRIKEYIRAGDVYQANLTQRFETRCKEINPWELYKRLMDINPSPFACFLNFPGVKVVSSSPERFLLVNRRYIETRPIKGTIKRGLTREEDEKNKDYLLHDEKNRAELAMIVDLMRNDIGRVCKTGSINVKSFPELETYSSVHHLVSTITGELEEDKNIMDVLKATFPGGSITGAPKIRAMEIIDELEPVERGIYTGSIGYLGFNGCMDLNIAIRTITITGDKAHIQAGGGIVADSVEEDEYDESLIKAQKLFKAFIKSGSVESNPV